MSRNPRLLIFTLGLVIFAGFLRFYQVEKPSFSIDESSSLFFATNKNWVALTWDNHPPLFHVLLKFWLRVFPLNEIGARALAILLSLVGVVAMIFAGVTSGNIKRGMAAAVLMAGSVLSIRYAQEARMYSMMEALASLQLAGLFYFIKNPDSTRSKRSFVAVAVTSVLTHIFGLLSVLMLSPSLATTLSRRQRWFLVLAIAASLAMTIGFALLQFDPRHVEWQKLSYSLSRGALANLGEFLFSFGQRARVATALFFAMAAASWFTPDPNQRRLARTLLIGIVSLVVAALFGEYLAQRRILIPRYFIFFNSFLIWLVVLGFEAVAIWIKSRRASAALAFTLMASFFVFLPHAYVNEKPDWRGLSEIAVREQSALVLSTRPRGFGVPYYSSHGIAFDRIDAGAQDFFFVLRERLRIYKRVMIVDDNLSRANYLMALTFQLNEARIPYKTFDIVNGVAGSVFGLILIEPAKRD